MTDTTTQQTEALIDILTEFFPRVHHEPSEDLIAELLTRTRALTEAASTPQYLPAAPAHLGEVLADIARRREHYERTGSKIMGHATGLEELDTHLGGLEPGRVTNLLAAPAAGKTTLSNQIAWHIASTTGAPVLYVSFENETSDLIKKTLARLGGVNPAFIDRGTLEPGKLTEAVQMFTERGQSLYYLSGNALTTVEAIRGAVASVIDRHPGAGHPVVIIDYLQQLARTTGGARDDIRVRVGMVSRGLTDIAKDYNAHVWAISSMNRESYRNGKSEAGMASGKESGDLEFDASHVITLTPTTDAQAPDANTDLLTLKIVKNRYGSTGTLSLARDKATLRMAPLNGTSRLTGPNGSQADRVRNYGRG